MCGIIGYIGTKDAGDILIEGLTKLEYRGYDSAGIGLRMDDRLVSVREVGKVSLLADKYSKDRLASSIGIGHTRWATHGAPLEKNAHPHMSSDGQVLVAHNGVIENYRGLKDFLLQNGVVFESDTDTEVIPQLISYYMRTQGDDIMQAIISATQVLEGTYGLAILHAKENKIYAVKSGSPLVIGVGNGEIYLASDEIPLAGNVDEVVHLEDGDIVVLTESKYEIYDKSKSIMQRSKTRISHEIESLGKDGYDYFMEKEIHKQNDSLRDSMRGRISVDRDEIIFGGIADHWDRFINASSINFIACGTSYHAGLVASYTFENLTCVPSRTEYASEFLYRNPVIDKTGIYIAISQSGETKDTLSVIQYIKNHGGAVAGLVNVVGSSIARESDFGIYIHAGPEIGVASTKAFTSQVLLLTTLALKLAKEKNIIERDEYLKVKNQIAKMPEYVQTTLLCDADIKEIAEGNAGESHTLFLGRGLDYPVALEAALKLKEISYIHAEGYPAAELKHGVIALIDENMPTVVIATTGTAMNKILGNMEEIKARDGRVIVITDDDTGCFDHITDEIIQIPKVSWMLTPILSVIPLQLYAYYSAVKRGCNVDQPRNLAKSVTVE